MSFSEVWRDSLKAALASGGNVVNAVSIFNKLQAARKMETEEARRQRMGQVARFAYKRAREEDGRGPEDIQYLDDELRITVRSSYSRRNDIFTTEVLVYIRADKTGSHHHLVIDETVE